MLDKFYDTEDQLVDDLFAETGEDEGKAEPVPAIQIVQFDDNDLPAASETRPLSSFLSTKPVAGKKATEHPLPCLLSSP